MRMKVRTANELLREEEKNRRDYEVEMKCFESKYGLSKLSDYSVRPPPTFWDDVRRVDWEDVADLEQGINWRKLDVLARKYEYPHTAVLDMVVRDLQEGARLGVTGKDRVASTSSNAASAMEHGEEVTDAIVGWLDDGYAIGPFDCDEIPFNQVRVSGLMCKLKPTGKARVIVNMSRGQPYSVNEGIDKDEFPQSCPAPEHGSGLC